MTAQPLQINVRILRHAEGLALPTYQTDLAAGADLVAAVPDAEPIAISAGDWSAVPTGLQIGLSPDHEAQIRPRSGLAAKFGVTVLNSPGTIDADYRGEIKVLLINHGHDTFQVTRGLRIAQMVIAPVTRVRFVIKDHLDQTGRGSGGFGSTGN
ncbi:MAG: dUTP diphosphatase [Pseudomonadota bacterium]